MKFRTKIWMLPLSAALVFIVGMVVSFAVGSRTSASLQRLQAVDVKVNKVLGEVAAIDGKTASAKELQLTFETCQTTALAATRAMLSKGDLGDQVARMQASQGQLDKLVKTQLAQAAAASADRQAEAGQGVKTAWWVNFLTGAAVLLVLGVVSRLVIGSVWRDLGEEPTELLQLTRDIAAGNLHRVSTVDAGDDRSLNAGLAEMMVKLRDTIGTIRQATDSIAMASNEIAIGNQDLSVRTETTASNLQATASSVETLTDSVRQSAESARQLAGRATPGPVAQQAGPWRLGRGYLPGVFGHRHHRRSGQPAESLRASHARPRHRPAQRSRLPTATRCCDRRRTAGNLHGPGGAELPAASGHVGADAVRQADEAGGRRGGLQRARCVDGQSPGWA